MKNYSLVYDKITNHESPKKKNFNSYKVLYSIYLNVTIIYIIMYIYTFNRC